jgi:hypothetical protein
MTAQTSLFDAPVSESEKKETALDLKEIDPITAADLTLARHELYKLAYRRGFAHGVQRGVCVLDMMELPYLMLKPKDYGPLFRGAPKLFRKTRERILNTREGQHCREITVWQAV